MLSFILIVGAIVGIIIEVILGWHKDDPPWKKRLRVTSLFVIVAMIGTNGYLDYREDISRHGKLDSIDVTVWFSVDLTLVETVTSSPELREYPAGPWTPDRHFRQDVAFMYNLQSAKYKPAFFDEVLNPWDFRVFLESVQQPMFRAENVERADRFQINWWLNPPNSDHLFCNVTYSIPALEYLGFNSLTDLNGDQINIEILSKPETFHLMIRRIDVNLHVAKKLFPTQNTSFTYWARVPGFDSSIRNFVQTLSTKFETVQSKATGDTIGLYVGRDGFCSWSVKCQFSDDQFP